MCIFRNKWKDFEPTKQYLSIVSGLTSVTKLHNYSQKFKYIAEKGDYWKTPIEFLNDGGGDCEDFARFTLDVLHRILDIEGKFVIQSGYNKASWGNKIWNVKCHAICVFEWQGKFGVFSNNQLYAGIDNYENAGKILFVDGLKSQIVRDWQGKILSRKYKLIGVF